MYESTGHSYTIPTLLLQRYSYSQFFSHTNISFRHLRMDNNIL